MEANGPMVVLHSDLKAAPGRQGLVPRASCGTLVIPPATIFEGEDTDLGGGNLALPELTHGPQEVVLVISLRLVAVEFLHGGQGVLLPLNDLTGLVGSIGDHVGGAADGDVLSPGGVVVVQPGAGVTDTTGRGGLFSKPGAEKSSQGQGPGSYAIKTRHPKPQSDFGMKCPLLGAFLTFRCVFMA